MDFQFATEQKGFVEELRAFIAQETPQELFDARTPSMGIGSGLSDEHPTVKRYLHKLAEHGYAGLSWPEEYGGAGKTAVDDWLLAQEISYYDLPKEGAAAFTIGPTLIRVGTEEQKRAYLPGLLTGEVGFALGYTEPSGGTDLAALRTTAVREGDEYVINGQKIFTTGAHHATHLWLAARTDRDEPRHRGVSIIIVPMNTPGIEVRPLHSQAGERTNEVFLSDVRTPVTNLVGKENRGWYIAMLAIDFERGSIMGYLVWFLDALIEYVRGARVDGRPLAQDPQVRQTLGRLVADMEVGRLMGLRTAWVVDQGKSPNVESAMDKLWLAEFKERLTNEATSIIGPLALMRQGAAGSPMGGFAESYYRAYPLSKFAAGGSNMMRNIIAQRGLGMPRETPTQGAQAAR